MPNDPDKNNNFNGMNTPDGKNDFIDSSFAVQFKPGDKTESVADKLKESKNSIENKVDSYNDGFKDEFDDFVFDSSISAFKPFKAPEESKEAPKAEEPKADVPKAQPVSADPVFPKNGGTFDKPATTVKAPEHAKEAIPKFDDLEDELNEYEAKQISNDKIFKSGNGLDFATSEHDKKTSPFLNAEKPDIPAPNGVDIPRAEEKTAFKPAEAPAKSAPPVQSAGYRPYPSANKTGLFSTPTQSAQAIQEAETESSQKKPAEPAKPAASPFVAASKPAEPAKPINPASNVIPEKRADMEKRVAPAMTAKPAGSAKNAEQVKPVSPAKTVETAKPSEPARSNTAAVAASATSISAAAAITAAKNNSSANKPSAPVKTENRKVEPVKAPAETETPHRPAASVHKEVPKTTPAPSPATASAPSPSSSPSTAPAPASAPARAYAPAQAQRPGTSSKPVAPQTAPNSPFEPKGKQPVAATRGVMNSDASTASHHDNKTISPVTTVKKSKKKVPKTQKDPGLAGLITFLAIIFVAIGILWILDKTSGLKNLFGKKPIETIPTVSTTVEETVSSVEETTAVEETTTAEATTTTTTEATTTTTTAAETTTATTTEETTTEEPTTTTTEETTAEETTTESAKSTKSNGSTAAGSSINDFNTRITNFSTNSDGFQFDIELKNKSRSTASLPKSLYGLDITFFCDQSIAEITSEGMTFSGDGMSYRGTPNEISVEGGETYIFTVYVTTSGDVSMYGYNYAFFDWVK